MRKAKAARQAFKALTPEQQQFVQTRRAAATMAARAWLDFLGPIAAADAKHDAVTGLGKLHRGRDVPDELRVCVLPLLFVMREECGPAAQLGLSMDLNGAKVAAKQYGAEVPGPQRPGVIKSAEKQYWDPWLILDCRLGDRSRLHLQVATLLRVREIKKRGSSGKIKWKTKERRRLVVDARVEAKATDLALVAAPASYAVGDKMKLKPGTSRSRVALRSVTDDPDLDATLHEILRLVGDAHAQFAPAAVGGA